MKKNLINPEVLVATYNALAEVIAFCHDRKIKCYGNVSPDGDCGYFFVDEDGLFTPYEIRSFYMNGKTVDDALNYRDQLLVWLKDALKGWKDQRIALLEAEIEKIRKSN